jgi:hypothetical protein
MKMLFIFAIITITGCVGGKYNVHKTRIGTLILTYEKAYLDSVEYYFSKYDQIYLGDKKYDYTDWVLPESAIDSIIEKLILKEYPNVTYEQVLNDSRNKIEYYSLMKESGQYLYSNFMFIDNNDKNIVRIVLSVRGKFFFINKGNRGLLKNRESIDMDNTLTTKFRYLITQYRYINTWHFERRALVFNISIGDFRKCHVII